MKNARIIDSHGEFIIDLQTGRPLLIPASQFTTPQQSKDYLQSKGGAVFCCGYGNCKSEVHFRSEVKKVTGKRNRARPQTWVSNDVNGHKPGCPGPSEQSFEHMPHNGLALSEAIATQGEKILFHLNIEFGIRGKGPFNKASLSKTEDVQWRSGNESTHSYFSVNDLDVLTRHLTQIAKQGGKEALLRTNIAHEGRLTPLKDFIVRNNAIDRMRIIEGENTLGGLRAKADLQRRHNIKNPHGGAWIFGRPRLVMFEAAQNLIVSEHINGDKKVQGWHHNTGDGRVTYDKLHLQKTALNASDFWPNGGVVLAIPFIHAQQNKKFPIVHWSIKSSSQIDLNPSSEIIKILCWDGQNIPKAQQKPKQLEMTL